MSDRWAVVVRQNGKLLGRLTPEGTATRKNIFAAMFPRERAERVAADITAGGTFTAKAIPF